MGSLTPYAITCPDRVEISLPGMSIRTPAAASASRTPATELRSVSAIPSRPTWRARAPRSAGDTRESGECRVWLWRSRRMKEGAERGGSLKDLGRDSAGALIGGKFLVGIVTVEVRQGILRGRLYFDRDGCPVPRRRLGSPLGA